MIIIAVTAGAFVATNLDNLILLIALFARFERRQKLVAAGYFAGMLIIGAIGLAIGKATDLFPVEYLGYLGIIPVWLGVSALIKLYRGNSAGSNIREDKDHAVFAATLITQLSNGSDTVVTFSILFADSNPATDWLIALSFVLMLFVFASTAYFSLRHRWLSNTLERYGKYITPFILISVGLYVLSNTATDMLPG